ncbi:MAG TPA: AAA family ATPase [Luteibacter sp.]|jgi:energy-coupling factor transporter ATP-binding protein EcfA2|uniref:AAA family ATPase n=1 Tax=Luteibacter sp. TaxID=1886636 RepID=UPI002F41C174
MSEIYTELLAWSRDKIPLWRQDVLRRICLGEPLDDAAKSEVLAMLRNHHGVDGAPPPATPPHPFSADHFPGEALGGSRVSLAAIHGLKHVGQMPEGERLTFATKGLTIVYGNNGAGKSGYARVLKQACRARTPGKVYANAYAKGFATLTPEAHIDFEVDGQFDQEAWSGKNGHISKAALRAIPVFDSDCAKHYLQSKESPSFQPSALAALQRLGSEVSQWLKPALTAEASALAVDTTLFNTIPRNTQVGRVLFPVATSTDVGALAKLADLTEEEQHLLVSLPQDIAASDPTDKAVGLESAAARVEELVTALNGALAHVSDERVRAIDTAHRERREAETAEREVAKLLSSDDPNQLLPGTGQGLWVDMLRAARAFSVSDAYPGQSFPVTGDGAHCVLCQQPLGPEAAQRLHRFDAYIRSEASTAAQRARDTWERITGEVKNVDVTVKFLRNMAESLEKRDAQLPALVTALQEAMAKRLGELKASMSTADWSNLTPLPIFPEEKLLAVGKALLEQAAALRASLDPVRLAAMRAQLLELQARQQLGVNLPALQTVITNLVKVEGLNRCIADVTATTTVSRCATVLGKKHVSDALAASMQAELARLDIYHLRVGLSSSGDVGAVKVGVQLDETSLAPSMVLSEAEQKMCALAYFFAELTQSESTSGIVMDDPVTSLDHAHRTAVAKRLVDEAANRQVIVFTHDAVFYGELMFFCKDAGVNPEKKTVCYRAKGPGYIEDGFPYDLRKHGDRLKVHRSDQKVLEGTFQNPPGEDERLAMRNIYDDLRVTLEVGIEEVVLNGTVVRFRDGISVGRLDKVMLVQPDEFQEVQRLHDKFCRQVRAHAQAAGQQRSVPQPGELLTDIEAVTKLFGDINKRKS